MEVKFGFSDLENLRIGIRFKNGDNEYNGFNYTHYKKIRKWEKVRKRGRGGQLQDSFRKNEKKKLGEVRDCEE